MATKKLTKPATKVAPKRAVRPIAIGDRVKGTTLNGTAISGKVSAIETKANGAWIWVSNKAGVVTTRASRLARG